VNDERHRPPIDEVAPNLGEPRAGGRLSAGPGRRSSTTRSGTS
jgi:hypothetical protein